MDQASTLAFPPARRAQIWSAPTCRRFSIFIDIDPTKHERNASLDPKLLPLNLG
jgi:hypothetical protein